MLCPCNLDYKLLLEYLKVFFAWPVIAGVLLVAFWIKYRHEIIKWFPRVNKLPGGVELAPEVAAKEIEQEILEVDKTQRPLQEAINRLPEGVYKDELLQLQAAASEADRQRAIAASLREQLEKQNKVSLQTRDTTLTVEERLFIIAQIAPKAYEQARYDRRFPENVQGYPERGPLYMANHWIKHLIDDMNKVFPGRKFDYWTIAEYIETLGIGKIIAVA